MYMHNYYYYNLYNYNFRITMSNNLWQYVLLFYVLIDINHLGIVYVTMSKTSEAALAQEELNQRTLPGHPKPMKVKSDKFL